MIRDVQSALPAQTIQDPAVRHGCSGKQTIGLLWRHEGCDGAAGGHWMHGTGRDTTTSGLWKPWATPARCALSWTPGCADMQSADHLSLLPLAVDTLGPPQALVLNTWLSTDAVHHLPATIGLWSSLEQRAPGVYSIFIEPQ